ncbi:MAG: L,D-transpeptidase [Verrucomicrobiota bacterium]
MTHNTFIKGAPIWCLLLCIALLSSCKGRRNHVQPRPTQAKKPEPYVPSGKIYYDVLAESNRSNTSVVIDVADQKSFLLVNGRTAAVSPVSTARPGKYTPRGSFRITERVRSGKISTIYNVGMPYWMRLNSSAYGMHAGHLPGYPASAGCVRMPTDMAQLFYDNTQSGTRVNIYSSWSGG